MMACTRTVTLIGIDGFMVTIEVDITQGLPAFIMVGLAEGIAIYGLIISILIFNRIM